MKMVETTTTIPRDPPPKVEVTMSAFEQHLEEAAEIVSKWPEWKRNILGRVNEPEETK